MTREKPFGRGCYREGVDGKAPRGIYSSTEEVRRAYDLRGSRPPLAHQACASMRSVGRHYGRPRASFQTMILPEGLEFQHVNKTLDRRRRSPGSDRQSATACAATRTRFSWRTACARSASRCPARRAPRSALDDMVIPASKATLLAAGVQTDVRLVIEAVSWKVLITDGERYNKVVDIWADVADKVAKDLLEGVGRGDRHRPRDRARSRRPLLQPDLHDGRLGRAARTSRFVSWPVCAV